MPANIQLFRNMIHLGVILSWWPAGTGILTARHPYGEFGAARSSSAHEVPMKATIRRHLRQLWDNHGGGFYGFVATGMFLYLEAIDLIPEVARIGEVEWTNLGWWISWWVGNLIAAVDRIGAVEERNLGWWVSWSVGNVVDAVTISVHAAIWPATWISHFGAGLASAAGVGSCYLPYLAVRPAVLRMLHDPEDDEAIAVREAKALQR